MVRALNCVSYIKMPYALHSVYSTGNPLTTCVSLAGSEAQVLMG